MITTLMDFMKLIESYQRYLDQSGVHLDEHGFPVMRYDWYLQTWPEQVVPYPERKSKLVTVQSNTVLNFYCADKYIYPRLEHVLDDLDEYRKFMGVIGSDLTVTPDMDVEWQQAVILINQLFDAILGINGVKLVQNLRTGAPSTTSCLLNVPYHVMGASGTLGCAPTRNGDFSYAVKLRIFKPSGMILYGRHDDIMKQHLHEAGVPYHWYDDAHTQYKRCRQLGPADASLQSRIARGNRTQAKDTRS